MKVAIDIQPAIAQRAGVGRYTKSLVEHIGRCRSEADRIRLCFFDFKSKGASFQTPGAELHRIAWCPGRVAQKAWKTVEWPPYNWFSGAADVFHFPNFIIPPVSKGRKLVTIHDVSFLRLPQAAEPKNLRYLTEQIHQTIDRADLILTVSRFSGREMQELLMVPEDRIRAIHLGLDPVMKPPDEKTIELMRNRFSLHKPYLLFVGTLEPRKNIPFLIDSFERMERFDGDLVICGMQGWKYEPILERMRRSSRMASIRYLQYVDERWMPALYAAAECFLFPSLYEGFGFPPLEAMQYGTPVLSSRSGSLPEVLGQAARYTYITDPSIWAEATIELLGDSYERQRLRKAGLEHVKQFDWMKTAQQTWQAYCEAAL